MNYGDFSSLVQLGVGLHVGTAILQLYGEFGTEPLVRCLARIKASIPEAKDETSKQIREQYADLSSDYEIFKIRLFQEYRKYLVMNSIVALSLTAILTVLAFKAQDPIVGNWQIITIPIVALSVLPAVGTLACLWIDASKRVKALIGRAEALEYLVLRMN